MASDPVRRPAPKPVPVVDGDSTFFWEKTRCHELWIQHCDVCGHSVFYPRALCTRCMGELSWRRAAGTGTVYSFTVVHRPASSAFAQDVPYVVGLVDLSEGARILTQLVNGAAEGWRIGQRVEVTFADAGDEIVLPAFQPAPQRESV